MMFSYLQAITYPSSIIITSTPVFLKLGSAKGFQVFWEIKMCNGRTVLLVVLNLYIWIKIHVATFDTNHSITDSTQSIAASIHKLPVSVVMSLSRALHFRQNNQVIDQFEVSHSFFTCNVHQDKQMLVSDFIVDLLWI